MVGNRMNCLMKKSFVFAVVAVVLSACATKENPYTSELIPEKTPDGKVIIYATLPEFESADGTKAAVYPTSGLFDWQMEDKIDVVFSNGVDEETHTFECTNIATGAFSFDGDVTSGYSVVRAYYPSGYNGTPSVQHFASLADAAKGFQMEATVSGGKLQFEHENALFAITVKNLPLFAKTVWINSASVDVTSESGDVNIVLPVIPAASAQLEIGVTDAAWDAGSHNDLISKKSEKSAEVVAKKLYNLTDLEIVPEVHFVSGRTGWDPVDGNKLSVDGSGNSLKERFVVLGGDEWFRFTAKYGALEVKYGYASGKDYNNSDPFVAGNDGSAHITTNGIYNVEFNFVSGTYTVTKTGDVSVYLIGIDGNWAFNNNPSCRLTNLYGNMWIWKGNPTSTIYKAYVGGNGNWDENTFGTANGYWTDSIVTGTAGSDAGVANDGTVIVTIDFGTDPWIISSERATAADGITVKMRHSLNGNVSWSDSEDITFTQHPTYPTLFWIEDLTVTSEGEGEFILYDNSGSGGSSVWWGVKDAGVKNVSAHPYAQLTSSSGLNMFLPAGTYTIYFNVVAHTIGVIAK